MQVILDSSFARPGSAPIWGGKKGEFRDWTTLRVVRILPYNVMATMSTFPNTEILLHSYSVQKNVPIVLKQQTSGSLKKRNYKEI